MGHPLGSPREEKEGGFLMENVEYKSETLVRLYRLYMEIIALATGVSLVFPVIFLFSNGEDIPKAITLGVVAFILMVLSGFLYIFTTGELFPWIPTKKISRILYAWGLVLLSLAACLVYYTGGIQSSIFVWLFAYAVIVTILVRPKHEQTLFKQWRPVLFTGGFEFLIIGILMCLGGRSVQIPNEMGKSMPFWGGGSALFSLIASFFLLYISEKILKVRS